MWLSRVVGPWRSDETWEERKGIEFITSSAKVCGFMQSKFFALLTLKTRDET